jgi:hypothetical protein
MSSEAFNTTNYIRLIQECRDAGYAFREFNVERSTAKTIFLRFDVDYSLRCAELMAEINKKLDVSATFFILIQSPLYNPLSEEARHILNRINELGQRIGLHLVLTQECTDLQTTRQKLMTDAETLARICHPVENVFSWHNPCLIKSGKNQLLRMDYSPFVNVYSDFISENYHYVTDANLRIPYNQLIHTVKQNHPCLQMCLHPSHWFSNQSNMKDVILLHILNAIKEIDDSFSENLVYKAFRPDGILPAEYDRFLTILRKEQPR